MSLKHTDYINLCIFSPFMMNELEHLFIFANAAQFETLSLGDTGLIQQVTSLPERKELPPVEAHSGHVHSLWTGVSQLCVFRFR